MRLTERLRTFGAMDIVLTAEAITFAVAFLLTICFGAPTKLLTLGAVLALLLPIVLAAWDPDGPPDPKAFLDWNFSPGEWSLIGLVIGGLLRLGWSCGIGAGVQVRKSMARRRMT